MNCEESLILATSAIAVSIAVVPDAFSWPLEKFPRDILGIIFKDFDAADYWALAGTCKRFRSLCLEEKLW